MNSTMICESVRSYTSCPRSRTAELVRSVKQIVQRNISGDFIECGVYKGGQVMAMILMLMELGETTRHIFLYDTFEGVPMPEDWEVKIGTEYTAKNYFDETKQNDGTSGWCRSTIEEVKANVLGLGYDNDKIHFIKGKVEDTLPTANHEAIALLRLDTDLYSSTKAEMQFLFPKVVTDGIVILDDYGCWSGAKQAVDEYMVQNKLHCDIRVIDKSARKIVKC